MKLSPVLKHFMRTYWSEMGDSIYGDIVAAFDALLEIEGATRAKLLVDDICVIRSEGYLTDRPRRGSKEFDFWTSLGRRWISEDEARKIEAFWLSANVCRLH